MTRIINLTETKRQEFTSDDVKYNKKYWIDSDKFNHLREFMTLVGYKALPFKSVKWEPIEGVSTQKPRSSGSNEAKEELEESIRDGWQLKEDPLHVISYLGNLNHGTGKTRYEILSSSYNYKNAPTAIWEPKGENEFEQISNIEAAQIFLNGKPKSAVAGYNTKEDIKTMLISVAKRYKKAYPNFTDLDLQVVLTKQKNKSTKGDPRWKGTKLSSVINEVMDIESNKNLDIYNYDNDDKVKLATENLKGYDKKKLYFPVSMETATNAVIKGILKAVAQKKQVHIITYLKSLPTSKQEDYIKVFNSKYKKFIKQYKIVLNLIKPTFQNKVFLLGAFPMVKAEHVEHELVKPYVENKKTS